jgi:hypothetical protein
MKKILLFTLLLISFIAFGSCSGDDTEEYKYIDVNILNGRWETTFDDTIKGRYEFNNGTVAYNTYSVLSGKKIVSFEDRFRLTADKIIYYGAIMPMRQSYLIKDDSLFITGLKGPTFKYIKQG